MPTAVYLYFYTDSVAFPRLADQSLDETWPYLLAERLRKELGVPVFPCLRGLGGGTIAEVYRIFLRDAGYFRGQGDESKSFVIFNLGVVDAAPQPFTYALRNIARLPRLGPLLWGKIQSLLAPHRGRLQKFWSYRRTSPGRFSRLFRAMLRQTVRAGMIPVSIDTPVTPLHLESRSPGLRESIAVYNRLKRACLGAVPVAADWVTDVHYLECGHHFNATGHAEMAKHVLDVVLPLVLGSSGIAMDRRSR